MVAAGAAGERIFAASSTAFSEESTTSQSSQEARINDHHASIALAEQVRLLESRHCEVVRNLEAQLAFMTQDRDRLAAALFEAEERQRIADAELELMRRMQGCLARGHTRRAPLSCGALAPSCGALPGGAGLRAPASSEAPAQTTHSFGYGHGTTGNGVRVGR